MRLPLSWLNEYVKVDDLAANELAERLTRAGLQVEAVETIGPKPLSDDFVVGEVTECAAHPDSDHLHVLKVTDGRETYQVVCGAPNARAGMKTALAKIGAVIPDGGFKIKKGRLRGVDSFGMCCSYRELGFGQDHSGIIDFPAETQTGAFVRDVIGGEKPETVLDVEITWNRPDALSIIGLAREFAAILHRELRMPAVDFVEEETPVENEVKVVVEDTKKCPRYTARVVTYVEDGPSPEIIAKRLELCGVRSLGLIVDVTNYVMLELGQPLHAFDHRTLKDRTIVVRNARAGETMTTLDGIERKLDETMLMICDAEKPNAVAGVMGGENSGIAPGTTTVMLESALFECESTKYTATKLGISSEAAYRYIRGVDKDLADYASRRAAHLLQKYGKARIAKGVIDADYRTKPLNEDVTLDFERARRLIGIPVGNDAMVFILRALGLTARTEKANALFAGEKSMTFGIPSWRYDLTLEADLVEEIARIYGLDNIPDKMPGAPSVSPLSDDEFKSRARVRQLCVALGFTEAMHYSFLSAKALDAFDTRDQDKRLVIPDPVSADYGVMRPSLLPQLMESLGRNASHQLESAMLFELGKVFDSRPGESERLSLGFVGAVGREALNRRKTVTEEEAVLWMKGAVEELVKRLHAGKLEFAPEAHPAFANGASLAVVLNGRRIGIMGALSAKMRHPYRLTTQMALCELDLPPLLKRYSAVGKISAVAPFPLVRRDIAILAAPGISHDAIEKTIRRNGGKELAKVSLFDIFKPKDAPKGARSLAYSLEFRSNERTLTDAEVAQSFQRVVDALKSTAGIEVREN